MRRHGSALVWAMVVLAVGGALVAFATSRFAAIGAARPQADLRQELLWAARTAALAERGGAARGVTVQVTREGGRVIARARKGPSTAVVERGAGVWTERFSLSP